jgi:hypothetical protein
MAHHKSNIGFFAVIGGSLLAAAFLVALLVGGQLAGLKVALNASPPIAARSRRGLGQPSGSAA